MHVASRTTCVHHDICDPAVTDTYHVLHRCENCTVLCYIPNTVQYCTTSQGPERQSQPILGRNRGDKEEKANEMSTVVWRRYIHCCFHDRPPDPLFLVINKPPLRRTLREGKRRLLAKGFDGHLPRIDESISALMLL